MKMKYAVIMEYTKRRNTAKYATKKMTNITPKKNKLQTPIKNCKSKEIVSTWFLMVHFVSNGFC